MPRVLKTVPKDQWPSWLKAHSLAKTHFKWPKGPLPREITNSHQDCLKVHPQWPKQFLQPDPLCSSLPTTRPSYWLCSAGSLVSKIMPYLPGDPLRLPSREWLPLPSRGRASEDKKPQSSRVAHQHTHNKDPVKRLMQHPELTLDPQLAQYLAALVVSMSHLDTDMPSVQTNGLWRDRGTILTSTWLCRRIGLVLPKALSGKPKFKYLFS